MKKTVIAIVAAGLLAVLTACGGDDTSSLRVGTLGDAPPNIYVENGNYTGFDNELLKAIATKQNLKLEFAATEFSEVMSIQTKDGSSITDENSLAGKRIAVIQGTVGDKWLTSAVPAAQAVRFPDYAAALGALKSDSVQGYILDQAIAEKNVTQNPDTKLKVTKSFTTEVPHGFAVKKGNAELLGRINEGLKQVIADGTWEQLHQRFLPTAPMPDQLKAGAR